MNGWMLAAKLSDVVEDKANMVKVGDRTLALYRVDGMVYASHGFCPHEGECFETGFVENGTVECALHYAVFEISTGALISGPTTKPLPVYPVRIDGDHVYVEL